MGIGILGILYVKKKRRRQKVGNSNVGEGLPGLPAEMEDQTGWIHIGKKWLLGGRWRWEADSKTRVPELDAEGRTHELDGEGLHQELEARGVDVVVVPGEPVELDAAEGGKEEGPESEE